MSGAICLRARAKLNISLEITGRRADGYHLVDTVMLPVTAADTLTLARADATSLRCDTSGVPLDRTNLVLRAHALMERLAGRCLPCAFALEKRVPMQAGLGGGSADAAAAMAGLNELYHTGIDRARLAAAAEELGADVPFFLHGGAARARGIGSLLESIPCGIDAHAVIIAPCAGLSTPEVFARFDAMGRSPADCADTPAVLRAAASGDISALKGCAANALQPPAELLRPAIASACAALYAAGAEYAAMTGSGCCVFGLFSQQSAALAAAHALSGTWPHPLCCRCADMPAIERI